MVAGFDEWALRGISRSRFSFRLERFGGASHYFGMTDKTSCSLRVHFEIALTATPELALWAGCLARKELRDDFVGGTD